MNAQPMNECECGDADTAMARVYELEIDTQYLPLSIYTFDVDYTDVSVQVGHMTCKGTTQTIVQTCRPSVKAT